MPIYEVIKVVASWRSLINGVVIKSDKQENPSGNVCKVMKFDELTAAEVVGYPLDELKDYL